MLYILLEIYVMFRVIFSSSMDRNDFYLITVIFSEYMTYVCTNFLRFCELEGIEYCYSRWL